MCDRCQDIDKTIERYRGIKERVAEQTLVDRAKELIAGFEADKAALQGRLVGGVIHVTVSPVPGPA